MPVDALPVITDSSEHLSDPQVPTLLTDTRVEHHSDREGAFIDQLERQAAGGNEVVRDVVLAACRGISAYASGDFAGTVKQLQPLVRSGDLVRLGGSNAQREVFEDTLIAALVGRGDRSEATGLLDERLARRASHSDAAWLAAIA